MLSVVLFSFVQPFYKFTIELYFFLYFRISNFAVGVPRLYLLLYYGKIDLLMYSPRLHRPLWEFLPWLLLILFILFGKKGVLS